TDDPPPSQRGHAPPLPRRRGIPSMKGGTLGGIGPTDSPHQTQPLGGWPAPAGAGMGISADISDDEPTHVGPAPARSAEPGRARNPMNLELDEFDDITSPDVRFSGARLPKLPPVSIDDGLGTAGTQEMLAAPTQPNWEPPEHIELEPPLPPGAFADRPPS